MQIPEHVRKSMDRMTQQLSV